MFPPPMGVGEGDELVVEVVEVSHVCIRKTDRRFIVFVNAS